MNITALPYQSTALSAFGATQSTSGAGTVRSSAMTLASDPQQTAAKAEVLSNDLMARLDAQAQGEDKDASTLALALSETIQTIGEKFGDDAATASIALIMGKTGQGDINEETLGQGLLDVVRFIDSNFGFDAGDEVMSLFNGQLNTAINDYFDNGMLEQFYAVSAGSSTLTQAIPDILSQVSDQFGAEAAEAFSSILMENLSESPSLSEFRQALAKAKDYLSQNYGQQATDQLAAAAGAAVQDVVPSTALQPGALLDLQV